MEGINPIAAIVQPTALKPPVFVGLASALCALSGSIIALRLWTNLNHLQKLYVDDCTYSLLVPVGISMASQAYLGRFKRTRAPVPDMELCHLFSTV